jgi:hypothetical protein
MNQSRNGESSNSSADLKYGCSRDRWFSTRSTTTWIPRRRASAMNARKSSFVPYSRFTW